jgi:hypothetical protein
VAFLGLAMLLIKKENFHFAELRRKAAAWSRGIEP